MGEDIILEIFKEFIPEKVAQWEDEEVPIGSMFALLDLLTPEQLVTFQPGEGGMLLAVCKFKK